MNIFSLLGLAPNERRNTMLLVGNNFFEGLSIALFYSVALSFFLDHNPIYRYGWLMVASGAFVILFTVFFEKVEHHMQPDKLFRLLAICSLAVFAIGFLFMQFGEVAMPAATGFALMILYHLVYFLYKMRFWGLSAMFFDVRQSKRLFGLISSVYLPAKFLGYTLVTTLDVVADVGKGGLLLMGVICYIVSFLFMRVLNRENKDVLILTHDKTHKSDNNKKSIVSGIFRLSMVMIFTMTFISFLFAKEVQHHFELVNGNMFRVISEALAISYGLAAVVKIVASGRLLTRISLKKLLVITPLLLAISILVHWLLRTTYHIQEQEYLFFVMLMIGSLMLTEAIDQPLIMSLFQPLSKKEILGGHTKVKGYGESIGVITMGLVLTALYNGHKHIDLKIAIPLVFAAAVIWVIAGWIFAGKYLGNLRNLIDMKLITGSKSFFIDQSLEDHLLNYMDAEDLRVVEHTAKLLEEQHKLNSDLVSSLIVDEDERKRQIGIDILCKREKLSHRLEKLLLDQLETFSESQRSQVIEMLAQKGKERNIEDLLAITKDTDEFSISLGLARNKHTNHSLWLRSYITRNSYREEQEIIVNLLTVMHDFVHFDNVEWVRQQLRSDKSKIQDAAIETAGKYTDWLIRDLLELVAIRRVKRSVQKSMSNASIKLLQKLKSDHDLRASDYMEIVLKKEGDEAANELIRLLLTISGTRRGKLIRGMCLRDDIDMSKDDLMQHLEREQRLLEHFHFKVEDHQLLSEAIVLERMECVERMLGLCYLHTQEEILLNAQKELFLHGENKLPICIEALQVSLPSNVFSRLRTVLEDQQEESVLSYQFAVSNLEPHKEHLSAWIALILSDFKDKDRSIPMNENQNLVMKSAQTQEVRSIDRVMLLRQTALFEEIRDNRLLDIAELLDEVSAPKNSYIFEKGDPGDALYIITDGEVAILDGKHELVKFRKGDFFGDLSLLDPAPRSATAKATQETLLLKLDESAIYELMLDHIEVVKGILGALCKRIRNQNKLYVEEKNKVSHEV